VEEPRQPYQVPPPRPRGEGDAWVEGPEGRFWGKFGAAGLLLYLPGYGVLLQLRAAWSHQGGTWGLPGGARDRNETAEEAALREAEEEAGIPEDKVVVVGTELNDLGYWSYTTVIAQLTEYVEPFIGDAESAAMEWVAIKDVDDRLLHPGFASSWPTLRRRLGELDPATLS